MGSFKSYSFVKFNVLSIFILTHSKSEMQKQEVCMASKIVLLPIMIGHNLVFT